MAEPGSKNRPRVLITVTHSPYGSSLARAGIEAALAMAAFDQPIAVLFMGAGVLNLLPQQDARAVGARNIGRLLDSMPLYDIEVLHVDADAVARFGIAAESLPAPARLLGRTELQALLATHDHLLGF